MAPVEHGPTTTHSWATFFKRTHRSSSKHRIKNSQTLKQTQNSGDSIYTNLGTAIANTCTSEQQQISHYLNSFLRVALFDDFVKSWRPSESVICQLLEIHGAHGGPATTDGVIPVPFSFVFPASVRPVVRPPPVAVVFRPSANIRCAIVVILPSNHHQHSQLNLFSTISQRDAQMRYILTVKMYCKSLPLLRR